MLRPTLALVLPLLQVTQALTLGCSGKSSVVRAAAPPIMIQNPFDGVKNPFQNLQDGATALGLTVAFYCQDRGPSSLLGQLDAVAASADTSTAEGLSDLCSKTALLLLRRQSEWIMCSGTAQHKRNDEDALSIFDRLAIREAAKFDDRDPSATVDAALAAAGLGGKASKETPTTVAVVSAVCCLLGDRQLPKSFNGDSTAMRKALEEVAAAGNGIDEVFAFELLWVPGDDEEALDMDEVAMDWPELIAC